MNARNDVDQPPKVASGSVVGLSRREGPARPDMAVKMKVGLSPRGGEKSCAERRTVDSPLFNKRGGKRR